MYMHTASFSLPSLASLMHMCCIGIVRSRTVLSLHMHCCTTLLETCVCIFHAALDMTFGFEAPWPLLSGKAYACATRLPRTRRARDSYMALHAVSRP